MSTCAMQHAAPYTNAKMQHSTQNATTPFPNAKMQTLQNMQHLTQMQNPTQNAKLEHLT